ncbi:predicted protein [Histoplasma mississippiense (nom. inval.)]|uniref:predicted protein n=1 Tax=Ajellomyces capsulatus (strain NAm1 / WU24) TaxID=2059318 RepID=UPI000157B2AC|nr:predicted protein [Histoplasma mississippiense (nom. inval.)]EDN02277.1 predicted protein [Histoplasma mississippiense (nom. inval.)]
MPKAMKLNGKSPVTPPLAQTPPCTPIDESPQQSVTTGDGYQHSDAKELVEALREARADSTTSKSNPSEDTAGGCASPEQDGEQSGTPVVDAAQYAWGERKPSPTDALADADSWVAKARKERGKPENYVRARAIANPTDSFEGLAESSQAQNA